MNLNKEIKLFNKSKLPSKKKMNLYVRDVDKQNDFRVVVPIAIILFIFVAIFCKFGVIDLLNEQSRLEREVASLNSQVTALNKEMETYNEVRMNYRRYSDAYLATNNADMLVNRLEIIQILEDATKDLANIESFSITGNNVTLYANAKDLDLINQVRARFESYEAVSSVYVYTADKNSSTANVSVSIVLSITKVGEK